jgi:MFS family permease
MLAILRRRDFGLLWFGGLISISGSWVLHAALPFYVYDLTGSALATGVMFIVRTLPSVLFATVAGVYVDRWDRKRTMVIANLFQASLLLLLLTLIPSEWLWVVYLVAFIESTVAQFFIPAENAMLPRLVGEEHLIAANSLSALKNNLGMLIGPAIGGALMELLGLTSVVLVDSASYLIAGLMISSIRWPSTPTTDLVKTMDTARSAEIVTPFWVALWQEWLAGLRLMRKDRLTAAVFVATGIAMLGEGILIVLLVPFVELLQGGALELGWLLTVRGLGGLVGGLVVGRLGNALKPSRVFSLSLGIMGLLGLMMYNVPTLIVALAAIFLIGVPAMGAHASSQTLLQSGVADCYLGRIFGALGMTVGLATLGGQGLASVLGDRLGIVVMLNASGGLYVLAGVVALNMVHVGLSSGDTAG